MGPPAEKGTQRLQPVPSKRVAAKAAKPQRSVAGSSALPARS